MENGNAEYFDLAALQTQYALNLKEIADEYDRSAGDYFGLLSDFMAQAPGTADALAVFAKLDGNIKAYRSLDNMASLLKSLKCALFVADFYSILGAYEQGNWKLAAFIAERTAKPFGEFARKIAAARKPKKPDGAPGADLPLKEYIERLDGPAASPKPVILAVDDSPSILTSLSYLLGGEYKVYTLPKPQELEKVLKKLAPDLFLLDYEMPVVNGFELVPVIRSFEAHKNTPIIYLTAIGTMDIVTSALAMGACDFIVKPFNPDTLLEKIKKWMPPRRAAGM